MKFKVCLFIILLSITYLAYILNFGKKPNVNINDTKSIQVKAHSIASLDRFHGLGKSITTNILKFKHGIRLDAEQEVFGGISGLHISKTNNTLTAITDSGNWISAKPVWLDGNIISLSNVVMAPIKSSHRSTLRKSGHGDIEALAVSNAGVFLGDESSGSTIFFASNTLETFSAPANVVFKGQGLKKLQKGRGVEAMAYLDPGTSPAQLLVIAERSPDANSRNVPAWLVSVDGPIQSISSLAYEPTPGFDVSDATFSKHCGLLILERRFSWLGYFDIRLKSVNDIFVAPGKTVRGETILMANSFGSNIDNMEGLSAVDNEDDSCDVFIISDDNFFDFQSTILLQFEFKNNRH